MTTIIIENEQLDAITDSMTLDVCKHMLVDFTQFSLYAEHPTRDAKKLDLALMDFGAITICFDDIDNNTNDSGFCQITGRITETVTITVNV